MAENMTAVAEGGINYAEKYASQIDERFTQVSLTDAATNQNFEFDGVNKVNIYSISTVPLNDYDINAANNRYGTPHEIGSTLQSMTLSQDKSFTFSIDKRNNTDTMMTHSVGAALNRQISEVLVPFIDKYRLNKLVANAPVIQIEDITTENAYTAFLTASKELFDKNVPTDGRIAFVSPAYYMNIKLDKNFTKNGDKGLEIAVNGAVGRVDNTSIVVVPTGYLPEGVNFIITHPCAMVAPKKIADFKQHESPQGINGWLVEGRIYFDAFILENKCWAIYVSKSNVYTVTFTVKSGADVVVGAKIYVSGQSVTTDAEGKAVISLQSGVHTYNVIAKSYISTTANITISGAAKSQAVNLETTV